MNSKYPTTFQVQINAKKYNIQQNASSYFQTLDDGLSTQEICDIGEHLRKINSGISLTLVTEHMEWNFEDGDENGDPR
jgi:hypothetical protein